MGAAAAAVATPVSVASTVTRAVQPLMQRYHIPGMAVGIVADGRIYVYTYGVSSKTTKQPINAATLFEIGSVSKTFTATLASYESLRGTLALSDMASADLPALRGSNFDRVSLVNLGTHTAGGLPLQVPDDVTNDAQLMSYLQHWKPAYPPGTYRVYSNVGIGLLGFITAARAHEDFSALMQRAILSPLGLQHTYLNVPPGQMANYAQGYTSDDKPIRMRAGELAAEAYGVRTTAGDMTRWLEANLEMLPVAATLRHALTDTQTGYYRSGPFTQDLIWEQYPYPVTLAQLEDGNSPKMLFDPNPATALVPPLQPGGDMLIDKTGSTNGFSAYIVYVPSKKIGVVLLANKSYPISARVSTAYAILSHL
jgi:beta-lactamase class C